MTSRQLSDREVKLNGPEKHWLIKVTEGMAQQKSGRERKDLSVKVSVPIAPRQVNSNKPIEILGQRK